MASAWATSFSQILHSLARLASRTRFFCRRRTIAALATASFVFCVKWNMLTKASVTKNEELTSRKLTPIYRYDVAEDQASIQRSPNFGSVIFPVLRRLFH